VKLKLSKITKNLQEFEKYSSRKILAEDLRTNSKKEELDTLLKRCGKRKAATKSRSTRQTCSHQWQKAGSVRTCQTPASRHSSTWRPSCVSWSTCRHGTTSWLAKKARKTAMYLVTWRFESDTFNCSGGLDNDWWWGGVESATVHRRLRVLMMTTTTMMMMMTLLPVAQRVSQWKNF